MAIAGVIVADEDSGMAQEPKVETATVSVRPNARAS